MQTPSAGAAPDLRVMTFNIRVGFAQDGANHWDHRKERVARTVRGFDPDVVGYQEVMPFQEAFLMERVPGYACWGGAQSPTPREEATPIAWKAQRFERLDAGLFHLSQTPERPGGDDWDGHYVRYVAWVKLADRAAGGRLLFVFNAHFDHLGRLARNQSAMLLRERIAKLAGDAPVIVLGDFNCAARDSEPYNLLMGETAAEQADPAPRLIDAFAAAAPPDAAAGTMHAFAGETDPTRHIDWVLHAPAWRAVSVEINRVSQHGRYPSDHFPVQAVLRG